MLRLTIPSVTFYDGENDEFIDTKAYELQLEHSLVSLAKWESKWHKPFLSSTDKTKEETIDYIKCMTISQNVDNIRFDLIPPAIINKILAYINEPMTATTFSQPERKVTSKEVITAEIVYYWMIAFNIPPEYQKWHLNRLLTLINVCSIKNQPDKKLSPKERKALMAKNKSLNEARKAQYGTKG